MKKKGVITVLVVSVFAASVLVNACRKKDVQKGPTPVTFSVPDNFPQPSYNFSANPLTEEGIELGRRLFYDGILSKDGNFPCASCHQQFAAFATFDHDLSHGFNSSFTTRNAPGLFNLAWQAEFHHDGGIKNLEVQPLAPITAPTEMAETVEGVIEKLEGKEQYRQWFREAFGDEEINSQRMLKALTQFSLTLVSADSRYDKMKRGEVQFSFYEQAGYTVFQSKCASCHQEPLFTDGSYRNNGLPLNTFLKDAGRMRITNNADDSLKFKVPSLRNVVATFPYTHDGRFYTLKQAIQHYRTGVNLSKTLDPSLRLGISLSDADVANLESFLKTLTDSSFLKDTRFAAPSP